VVGLIDQAIAVVDLTDLADPIDLVDPTKQDDPIDQAVPEAPNLVIPVGPDLAPNLAMQTRVCFSPYHLVKILPLVMDSLLILTELPRINLILLYITLGTLMPKTLTVMSLMITASLCLPWEKTLRNMATAALENIWKTLH
jgi:hypothetical protein